MREKTRIIAAAHRQARREHPSLLTVIVPRHPVRGPALRQSLAGEAPAGEARSDEPLVVALRSRGEPVEDATDIYIADTLGELGLFYRLATVALIGGTFVPVGGHNPIEAVLLGTAILHGPHVENAAEIYDALDRGTDTGPVADAADLASALGSLLADPAMRRARAQQAAAALSPYAGALDATMAALAPYLKPLAGPAADGAREVAP